MRLLIAEDDNDIRRALVALLQKNNYTVDETDNGTDAYTFASRGQYDGIILDIMMPGWTEWRFWANYGLKKITFRFCF